MKCKNIRVEFYFTTNIKLRVFFFFSCVDKMKKLPKGLKTWPAYSELKKKLDTFNECLPLLELLINPAMQVKINFIGKTKSFLFAVRS